MTPPTLPSMWADTLVMFNAFMNWDIVKGFIATALGLVFAGIALSLVRRIAH